MVDVVRPDRDVTVTFACGHRKLLGSGTEMTSVRCETCGERRVRAVAAPPPVVRAVDCTADGPLVQQES